MPSSDVRAHLAALYAASDDPWDTCTSPYEQGKFARTIACLPRPRYKSGLEVGCGAGTLSALLARRCDKLIAMDCTDQAVRTALARKDHTNVSFIVGEAPRDWPDHPPDLVILSEVLYFMTDAESAGLALRLAHDCSAQCHVVLVNWLGDTDNIGGAAAAQRLIAQLATAHHQLLAQNYARFRIDVLARRGTTPTTVQAALVRAPGIQMHGAGENWNA